MSVPAADNLRLCAEAATELDRPRMAEVITRHADLLEAIDALHQPRTEWDEWHECWLEPCCVHDGHPWPCPTARLLHPPVPAEETLPNTQVQP